MNGVALGNEAGKAFPEMPLLELPDSRAWAMDISSEPMRMGLITKS